MIKEEQPTRATADLAEYASQLQYSSLPPDVVERGRQIVLDTSGAMLAGSALESGQALLRLAHSLPQAGGVRVVGTTMRLDAIDAAMVNGSLAHADETDDSHTGSGTHPACVTVPAALAVTSSTGLHGQDLIAAVVAGYDVACRISKAMDTRVLRERGFSTLGICGTFAAAAAAGRAMGLSPTRMIDAFGLAGIQASGLNAYHQDGTHVAKALQVGFAVRNGVTAVIFAAQGSAPPMIERILEGPNNVVSAFSDRPRPSQLTDALGERFEIMGTSIKKHACGGPIRWAVDGLLELMTEHEIAADDIETVDVRLAHSSVSIVGPHATVPSINLPYVLAVAAIDGYVGIEQTHSPARLTDPRVHELQQRVRLAGDDDLEKVFPARQPAVVSIQLRNGRSVSRLVDFAAGSAERPLSRDEVEQKFLRLAKGMIGEAQGRVVAGMVWQLESQRDVRKITRLLHAVEGR
jgi:2-methylcitrate dehydratase PrpD